MAGPRLSKGRPGNNSGGQDLSARQVIWGIVLGLVILTLVIITVEGIQRDQRRNEAGKSEEQKYRERLRDMGVDENAEQRMDDLIKWSKDYQKRKLRD